MSGMGTLKTYESLVVEEVPYELPSEADDAVSAVVEKLSQQAKLLGEKYGISLREFEINQPYRKPDPSDLVASFLFAMAPRDHLSLERVRGEWGLWLRMRVGPLTNSQPSPTPLRDSPLPLRRAFLNRSEEFFKAYLDRVDAGLGESRAAIEAGHRALELIEKHNP
ncbi:hypothetical protein [Myxococcus faecalis]|uniref:hypothetical protein n=1 Tax=Myxococcus faecalis TaxID=3115646 RepID=UPI003CEFB9BF